MLKTEKGTNSRFGSAGGWGEKAADYMKAHPLQDIIKEDTEASVRFISEG